MHPLSPFLEAQQEEDQSALWIIIINVNDDTWKCEP